MTLTRTLPYADVELALTSWLQDQLGNGARVVTETPEKMGAAGQPSVVQVERIGGASKFTLDQPRVDVTTFAPDRQSSLNLSEQVRMLMEQTLPGTRIGSASFGAVFCDSGPSWAPWDNTNVRRFVASYQMVVHASQ